MLCIKKPFCEVEEIPLDAVEETVFYEEGYECHRSLWLSEKVKLEKEFKEDIIQKEKLTPSEKVDKCFSLAWDYGCSQGFREIHEYFTELIELIK